MISWFPISLALRSKWYLTNSLFSDSKKSIISGYQVTSLRKTLQLGLNPFRSLQKIMWSSRKEFLPSSTYSKKDR